MRKIRAKKLAKLARENDPNLLLSIRNRFGDKTKEMENDKIYRTAKKLWNAKVPERKSWGNK
jgi:hypothetical protein